MRRESKVAPAVRRREPTDPQLPRASISIFVSLFEPLCASLPSMPEVSTCFRLVQDCADCSRWLAMLSLELKTDVQLSSLSGDLPRLERDHSGWVLGVATGLGDWHGDVAKEPDAPGRGVDGTEKPRGLCTPRASVLPAVSQPGRGCHL